MWPSVFQHRRPLTCTSASNKVNHDPPSANPGSAPGAAGYVVGHMTQPAQRAPQIPKRTWPGAVLSPCPNPPVGPSATCLPPKNRRLNSAVQLDLRCAVTGPVTASASPYIYISNPAQLVAGRCGPPPARGLAGRCLGAPSFGAPSASPNQPEKEQQLQREILQADLRDLPALSEPQGLSGAALSKTRRGYRPYGRFAIDMCVSKNRERGTYVHR